MRKTVTFALLFTFALAAVSPTYSQRTADSRAGRTLKIPAQFDQVGAITDGAGVLVRWQMKSETGVSAYNVYRVSNGQKDLITPTMIAGSAARFGDTTALGEMYQFFDLEGIEGMSYAVEGTTLDGRRFISKEIPATTVKSVEAESGFSSDALAQTRLSTNSNIEARDVALSGELQDLVSTYQQEPDPEMQRWVAAQHGAKIMVRKSGFYRVNASELLSANFPINSDSTKWRLFMNGREQAITVGPAAQYIEFYGYGVDTPETDIRFYYLVSDTVAGKRIGSKTVRQIPGAATAQRYPIVAGKKERIFYDNRIRNGDAENFLGRIFFDTPTTIPFNLTAVDLNAAPAKLKISCFGFSDNPHHVTATINGHELPAFDQFGRVYFDGVFSIPTSYLQEGANAIELRTGAATDQALFDNFELTYQRKYVADGDKISFSTPGYKKTDISGFNTPAIRVYDMTFDGNPVRISNTTVRSENGTYTVQVPSGRMMVGYALEENATLQSPGVVENFASALSATANHADMLIISDPTTSFMNAAETWAAYRRSSTGGSFDVKVISISDIYDEFSYGTVGADALKSFLNFSHEEWATAPRYVLLLGDATYDPRNYEGYGFFNLIPTKSVTLIPEESFSDEALGDFNDDGLSELAIGRVSARAATDITAAFNKVRNYEQNQQTFNRGALFVHDLPFGFDFENMSQQFCQALPPGTPCTFASSGDADARPNVISKINEGNFVVNYSGHGASGLWASSNFFNVNDVASLNNQTNPSFFSMLTCLNGYFVRTNADSLAEKLVFQSSGGAAAGWGSTSETTPDVQLQMGLRFFQGFSLGTNRRLGDMIRDAKTVIDQGADVRLSWVLIGDPAMKMP